MHDALNGLTPCLGDIGLPFNDFFVDVLGGLEFLRAHGDNLCMLKSIATFWGDSWLVSWAALGGYQPKKTRFSGFDYRRTDVTVILFLGMLVDRQPGYLI